MFLSPQTRKPICDKWVNSKGANNWPYIAMLHTARWHFLIPHSVGTVTVMGGIFNALSVHLGVCTTNNQRGLYPSMYASALGRRHRAQVDANRWSVATAT